MMKRPLVLAHRGANAYAPENTLSAFLAARELGADGVELDVQLSRDGIPVVIHDPTLERTTDGRGRVSDYRIVELKQFEVGASNGNGYGGEAFAGERIPTLAEVFDALDDWLHPAGREAPGLVNVELKTDSLYSERLEIAVCNLIDKRNLFSKVLVSSYNPLALARLKNRNSHIRRGLLYDNRGIVGQAWQRLMAAPHALHPIHTLVTEELVKSAARSKLAINTWTVDDPDEARRLAELGVNCIITNHPEVIRDALES